MKPDNFTLHATGGQVWFYHDDLESLINSVTEEDKREIEKYSAGLGKIFGREIKLYWGYQSGDKRIENLLSHVSGDRQDLDLVEPDEIEHGHLKYLEHNVTNDGVRAPVLSIATMYISILIKQAVKYKNLRQL